MPLCDLCQTISIIKPPRDNHWRDVKVYTHTLSTLTSSAHQNCYLCYQLYEKLSRNQLELLENNVKAEIDCKMIWDEEKWDSIFFSSSRALPRLSIFVQYALLPCEDHAGDISKYQLPRTTDHEDCWALISGWLNLCEASHEICSTSAPGSLSTWRPSRLIDIGAIDSDPPRLIITEDQKHVQSCPYLALSHCWGNSNIPTLTLSNIHALQDAMNPSELPPNFRDAIHATRKLGFRYLWIDSLCIIQDSVEDWLTESAVMGKVYKNCTLCIAATASENSEGGLFQTRHAAHITPYKIDLQSRLHKKSYLTFTPYIWDRGVSEAPLSRRAWALQERLFATRTVHWGQEQIFWECRELSACETMPDKSSFTSFENYSASRSYDSTFKCWQLTMENALAAAVYAAQEKTSSLYRPWEAIVEEYSRCALTMPGDKLVALSGAALEMQTLLNDTYLAGLWRGSLVAELLWYVPHWQEEPESFRSQPYRAPSWSWASIDGNIEFVNSSTFAGNFIDILNAEVTPVSAINSLGRVIGGRLEIRGQLIELPMMRSGHHRVRTADSYYLDDVQESCEPCWGLPLVVKENGMIWGLLLTPTNKLTNEYRRVGAFKLFCHQRLEHLGGDIPGNQAYEGIFDRTTAQSIFTVV